MTTTELLEIISGGETTSVQFKLRLESADSIAAEMVAMSNTVGGMIIFGIEDKTGAVVGLDYDQLRDTGSRLATTASDLVKPSIFIQTEVVTIEGKHTLIVYIGEGNNKPYKDKTGVIWSKQGSDKRRLTENSEIQRLFQSSGNMFAEEMEVFDSSLEDIRKPDFEIYFKREFDKSIEQMGLTFEQALTAKRCLRNGRLTLAGLLYFGKFPQNAKPSFTIRTVSYFGNDLGGNNYRSKPKPLSGTIPELFHGCMGWLRSVLYHLQNGQNFNSIGVLEVSEIALIEIVQNALVHRDYFKNAPIRVLVFDNRIEIISPGKLPNSLTVEEIKYGNPVIRNNLILSFGTRTLPTSGLGSGIKRALHEQPDIEFINDEVGEQFTVIIPRPPKP